MSMNVGDLRNSVIEIVHASQYGTRLIGNLSGDQVQAVTWHRWVVWAFYKFIDLFVDNSWEIAQLKQAMDKTNNAFIEQRDALVKDFERYKELFRSKTNNVKFTEDEQKEFDTLDQRITDWNNQMSPVLHVNLRAVIDKVKSVYPDALGVEAERFIETAQHGIFAKVANIQSLKLLEQNSHAPIPFKALEMLAGRTDMVDAKGKPTEAAKQIDGWIANLNFWEKSISIKLLDEALKVFVGMVDLPGKDLSLDYLEWQLKVRKCTIFDKKDDEVMAFRKGIESGEIKSVSFDGAEYEIGEKIDKTKDPEKDRFVAYLVKSNVNGGTFALEIGSNSVDLRLKLYTASKYMDDRTSKLKIPVVDYFWITPNGTYALAEYLPCPLKYHANADDESIKRDNSVNIELVVKIVADMVKNEITPSNLSLKNLRKKTDGTLKTTSVLNMADAKFNFVKLLQFIEEFADGDMRTFEHILGHSNLSSHHYGQFISKCFVKATKEKSETLPKDYVGPLPITDAPVMDLATAIHQQVKTLITNYRKKVFELCTTDKNKIGDIDSVIGQVLFDKYGYGDYFSKDFSTSMVENEIVESIIIRGNYQRKDDEKKRTKTPVRPRPNLTVQV